MSADDISVKITWSEHTTRRATIKVDPAEVRYEFKLEPDDVITDDLIHQYLRRQSWSWTEQLFYYTHRVDGSISDDVSYERILDEINVIS